MALSVALSAYNKKAKLKTTREVRLVMLGQQAGKGVVLKSVLLADLGKDDSDEVDELFFNHRIIDVFMDIRAHCLRRSGWPRPRW